MIRGEEKGWKWARGFEDRLTPGGHETVEIDSVVIVYGENDEESWVIDGIEDNEASLIAAAPELLRLAEKLVNELREMDRYPMETYDMRDLIKEIREGKYGLL